MSVIITPAPAIYSKTSTGTNDLYILNGSFKFMGASVISMNCTLGYNGTPSSLSLTLVEDIANGDTFVQPTIPSIWAFGLPKGGVGAPIFFADGTTIAPNDYSFTGCPFYFCGICTNWNITLLDTGGRTISVSLVDPREILTGVQCLLNGFALSENIGAGGPRYTGVNNVIDVFGYYNYGLDANVNPYGIVWSEVQTVLEAVQVTLNEMNFEFHFTGNTYTQVPAFYRLEDSVIDIVGLAQKVAFDGGSDLVVVARKTASNACVVEFRGIQRTNDDILTQGDISAFIAARSSIVQSARQGREYRNEPTSSIVVGGMRNANYTALPSTYHSELHLDSGEEAYGNFPSDIKVRLFGGSDTTYTPDPDGSGITVNNTNYNINSGAIFPFWGFTPDDHAYPMMEPYLPLDHLAFDRTTSGNLTQRIPACNIKLQNFTVRKVAHQQMFLNNDSQSDSRPFAIVSGYLLNQANLPSGYTRGLPLNTEVLRAAVASPQTFYNIYNIHYPDIADALGFPYPDFKGFGDRIIATSGFFDGGAVDIRPDWDMFYETFYDISDTNAASGSPDGISPDPDPNGFINETVWTSGFYNISQSLVLQTFHTIIYDLVRNYALENMGKRFMVALPYSQIMQKIWGGSGVPTNPNRPDIEYIVDNRGYWETLPADLDVTTTSGIFTIDEKNQVTRKFMAEDNRFYSLVGIDWTPSGNINFHSNTMNRAMFQDFSVSDFRPNRIASQNPSYVLVACSVNQLSKRPDLAIVELPNAIEFQPIDSPFLKGWNNGASDPFIASKIGIIKYLWYFYQRDPDFRYAMELAFNSQESADTGDPDYRDSGIPQTYNDYVAYIINSWADSLQKISGSALLGGLSSEFVMDLKGVVIPLTSTWVSYGPYYSEYTDAKGMVSIVVDQSLVPWNFPRPTGTTLAVSGVLANLNAAGAERLARTICDIDYVDNASIVVAGFPEYGPASSLGYNSNLTGISVDFSIGAIKTVYSLSTYAAKPGTYRKDEYDDVSKARIDLREQLPQPINDNIIYDINQGSKGNIYGRDRFQS